MNKSIKEMGCFKGGYFVLNTSAKEETFEDNEHFVVTCKETKSLLTSIINVISTSQDYLKICSFIIDNKVVVEELEKKLIEGNVAIFILTAVDERNLKSDMLDEDEFSEFSKSRHFEFIDKLVRAGAHLKASTNAHAKFIIKDGDEALLMSANLTEPSLICNDKGKYPNDESGIIIKNRSDVNVLERVFDSIFMYGTEFKKFINLSDNTQLVSKQDIDIDEDDFPSQNSNIIWSYENIHHLIYKEIVSGIINATNSIKLSTYSIVELDSLPEFVTSIKEFTQNRNGSIKIFCRAMNHRLDHLLACEKLLDLGVEIFGDMFNHSKGISIDKKRGIIFTANIDGRHGLKNGFEVGYVLRIDDAYSAFDSFLDYQINNAPYIFKTNPQKEELFDFYEMWYSDKEIINKQSLPEFIDIKYRTNASYSRDFEIDVENYPIFYTVIKKSDLNEIQFEINGKAYLLEVLNSSTLNVKKLLNKNEIVRAEKYIFFYKNINLIGYEQ